MSKLKEYIFTFGYGQKHQNCFVAIEAETPYDARIKMVKAFENKWAFQYEPDEVTGETARQKAGVDRFNLTEIFLENNMDKFETLKKKVKELEEKAKADLAETKKLYDKHRITIDELHEVMDKHNRYDHFLYLIEQLEKESDDEKE